MRFFGRLTLLLFLITGIVVAIIRLRQLQTPFADVLFTGIFVVLGIVALFGLLIGAGKLLGKLSR